MTREKLKYDVLMRLNQNSDDSKFNIKAIDQWIDALRAQLLHEWIIQMGEIPNAAKKIVPCVSLKKVWDECDRCYYYILIHNVDVMSLSNDGGILNVIGQGGRLLEGMNGLGNYSILKNTRYSSKESWYSTDNTIYLRGTFADDAKFKVEIVPASHTAWGEDEEYPAPVQMINQILALATQIGLGQIQLPDDILNDGKDE